MQNSKRNFLISYVAIRRVIGILGMFLPLICVIGGYLAKNPLQPSISLYYYSNVRDIFVGVLFCVSIFLISYKGYALIDDLITSIIGHCGFFIAIFPCLYNSSSALPVGIFQVSPQISNIIHSISATTFFTLLAINSIFLFTLSKSECKRDKRNKMIRNMIYIVSGIAILVCVVILFIYSLIIGFDNVNNTNTLFIIESIMLFAFGISWFVKGETIIKDRKHIHKTEILITENVRTSKSPKSSH